MKRRKTDADIEEKVMAVYATCLNCSEVARRLKMSRKTVHTIVKRRSGDDVEELRASYRRDLAAQAWESVEALLPFVKGAEFGSERASRGSEAARAAHDLARVASLLDGRDKVDPNLAPAPMIMVNTHIPPPPEVRDQVIASIVAPVPEGLREDVSRQVGRLFAGGASDEEARSLVKRALAAYSMGPETTTTLPKEQP